MEPKLPEFLRISYDALTDSDLQGIIRICKLNPLGDTASDVLRKIADNSLSFWRLRDDKADVRLILEIRVHPNGNELLICGVFGRGLFVNIARCYEHCKLIANKYFCQRITGDVYSKGLGKLYEKFGGKPLFTRYLLEG